MRMKSACRLVAPSGPHRKGNRMPTPRRQFSAEAPVHGARCLAHWQPPSPVQLRVLTFQRAGTSSA
eukprot:364913-Chlamydomonas_euryale.AAC.2